MTTSFRSDAVTPVLGRQDEGRRVGPVSDRTVADFGVRSETAGAPVRELASETPASGVARDLALEAVGELADVLGAPRGEFAARVGVHPVGKVE